MIVIPVDQQRGEPLPDGDIKRSPYTGSTIVLLSFPWIIVFFGLGMTVGIFWAWVQSPSDFIPTNLSQYKSLGFFSTLGQQIGMGTWPFMASKIRQTSAKDNLGLSLHRSDFLRGVPVGVLGYATAFLVITTYFNQSQTLNYGIPTSVDGWTYAKVGLIIMSAPFVEELYFRGYLLKGAMRHMRVYFSVPLVSLLFVMVHYAGGSPSGFSIKFFGLLGVSFLVTSLTARTGRIGSSVIAHMTYNVMVLAPVLTLLWKNAIL